jgi:hypothetical protein
MRTLRMTLCAVALSAFLGACGDWLTTTPQTILTDEQVWGDPGLVRSVLADYYDRIPLYEGLENGQWDNMTAFDEAMYSGNPRTFGAGNESITTYGFGRWGGNWGGFYDLIRDIHVAMDGIEVGGLPDADKTAFLAEFRFIRALLYFELAKRYGGVPLITEQQIYEGGGDVTPLQHPRSTEAEVYDFIGSELDAILGQLGNAGSQTRANRWTALALKSRAMLYAGSLAQHNAEMVSPITLPGGEVGIPSSRADEYYQKSLDASLQLINSSPYSLYQGNFEEIFYQDNNEVIFAKDYVSGAGKVHYFALHSRPRSVRVTVYQDWGGAAISPTLNLVENFDYLDGSSGEMQGVGDGSGTAAGQADWIFYDEIDDIFDGKDGRMHGTVVTPGSTFDGQELDFQAGVYEWNGGTGVYERHRGDLNTTYNGQKQTGLDGPTPSFEHASWTGFYIRKHADPSADAATFAPGAGNWWVWFRLGEAYMNAAEAEFELGMTSDALEHINALRARAGFGANSLTSLTREKIRSERWSELAFEDHRLWDLIRWRVADQVWDGTRGPTSDLYVLFPYKIIRPGHPNDGKWVFDKHISNPQYAPRFFRMGNYYSAIPDGAIGANPELIRNPFH